MQCNVASPSLHVNVVCAREVPVSTSRASARLLGMLPTFSNLARLPGQFFAHSFPTDDDADDDGAAAKAGPAEVAGHPGPNFSDSEPHKEEESDDEQKDKKKKTVKSNIDGFRPKFIMPFPKATEEEIKVIDHLNTTPFGRSIPAAVMRDLIKYHVSLAAKQIAEELAEGLMQDGYTASDAGPNPDPEVYNVQQLGMALLHHESE
eukprot:263476-Rhodomonas_salina.1